eukprot:scaffold10780_cov78-Cyclotella_meneghiniana.AAC.15
MHGTVPTTLHTSRGVNWGVALSGPKETLQRVLMTARHARPPAAYKLQGTKKRVNGIREKGMGSGKAKS